jgi:hypothetical protein
MLGTLLVGYTEDHHPGALPRAVGTIRDHVSTVMETKAVLAEEGVTAGEPILLLRRTRLASGLLLSWAPPLPSDLRISRIFDVDDGQNVTLETGERAGCVHPSNAVVEVAMCTGLAANPTPEKLGPIRLLDLPDEKPILGLFEVVERKTGQRMLYTGDHQPVSDLNLEGHRVDGPSTKRSSSGCSGSVTSRMLQPEYQNPAT